MRIILNFILFKLSISLLISCNGQSPSKSINERVGGAFENGEFMYIGMPKNINSIDTSAGWTQNGQKLLITGTIYKNDGKTPAPDVILYYYHTDINGIYMQKPSLDSRVKRHGYIRGWVKSDSMGHYKIYTVRPASYPNTTFEAHIHPAIKEPNLNSEYYIDDFVFDDDIFLTSEKRRKLENRGGSGVLRVLISGDLQIAEHNIILGLNVPNYPESKNSQKQSGRQIGEESPSFTPLHAYGPDKGTKTCPVCKYGRYHGILYFVGNDPNWAEIKKWLIFLENESNTRRKYLKAYFVYGNEKDYNKNSRQKELEKIGNELNLKNVALTFVPSFTDIESEVNLNKINPIVENTIIIYKNRVIIYKYIDVKASTVNFEEIIKTLKQSKGDYFNLLVPKHN